MRPDYASPVRGGYPALIGPPWLTQGRKAALGQFTGRCTVRKASTQSGWNQTTHQPVSVDGVVVLADIPARLQSIGQSSTIDNAGQQVTTNRYRLSMEYRGDPGLEVGQLATFTAGVSLWLVGRPLVIVALLLSSLEWQHDVEVEANLG